VTFDPKTRCRPADMRLVDTHAHLDDSQFDRDLGPVVQRAARAGVAEIIAVGVDLASSERELSLAGRLNGVYATAGVHPHAAQTLDDGVLHRLGWLASQPRVVAIGEIGLDYYRNVSPRDVQRSTFRAQLELARELGKPVVVHIRDRRESRAAYEDALSLLSEWASKGGGARGVLHCFSGEMWVAEAALELGLYLGIDGPVTYPNAHALRALVAQLPLERVLLETDSPYLAPQGHRGRRNEPAYVVDIAGKIGEIMDLSAEAVARATTENAHALFGLSECLAPEHTGEE